MFNNYFLRRKTATLMIDYLIRASAQGVTVKGLVGCIFPRILEYHGEIRTLEYIEALGNSIEPRDVNMLTLMTMSIKIYEGEEFIQSDLASKALIQLGVYNVGCF